MKRLAVYVAEFVAIFSVHISWTFDQFGGISDDIEMIVVDINLTFVFQSH
jgi:hypothetical protein